MVFIGFSNVSELLVKKTLGKPVKTKKKKKHDFETMVQENQEFMVFIGFSNVSELLVKKTLEKTNKNHEFFIFFHHSLKIMFFLLAVQMFLSSWSWFFMVFIGFPMFLSFWLRKHWKTNKNKKKNMIF